MSDIDDDELGPAPPSPPSATAIGLTAWGCLLPNLAVCGFLVYLAMSEGGLGILGSTLTIVGFALFLLLMIFLLRKRNKQILIASLIIGFGFWLLLFGLCVGSLGGL